MSQIKRPPPVPPVQDRAWQHTEPAPLMPAAPATPRAQPPLREAPLKGLDMRELDSQTVFDQLFGSLPPAPPAPPRPGLPPAPKKR